MPDSALLILATLQQRNAVVLDEVKDITSVSRAAGVLCTHVLLEARHWQDIGRVFKTLKHHFTKLVDAKCVKERVPKELAILREAYQSWKVLGKSDLCSQYLIELVGAIEKSHTVSTESVKISNVYYLACYDPDDPGFGPC